MLPLYRIILPMLLLLSPAVVVSAQSPRYLYMPDLGNFGQIRKQNAFIPLGYRTGKAAKNHRDGTLIQVDQHLEMTPASARYDQSTYLTLYPDEGAAIRQFQAWYPRREFFVYKIDTARLPMGKYVPVSAWFRTYRRRLPPARHADKVVASHPIYVYAIAGWAEVAADGRVAHYPTDRAEHRADGQADGRGGRGGGVGAGEALALASSSKSPSRGPVGSLRVPR